MSDAARILLVTGTDQFQVVDRFASERDALAGTLDLAAGIDDFDGSDPDVVARAVEAARTPPMFGADRLVTLRHAITEETIPLIAAYCTEPTASTTLVLVHVRSGRATKAYKELEAAIRGAGGVVLEESAPPPRTPDLAAFISDAVRSHGAGIDRAAATYLAEHLGPDAGAIEAVAAQLGAAHPGGERLGVAAVSELVSGPALAKTWDLTDAIDAGDTAAALRALEGLLADMHPMQVNTAIANHVRRLVAASELDPASASEVEVELSLKAYPAKKVYEKVCRLPPQAFVAAHRVVARADVAIRGGTGLDARTVLETEVVRLGSILGSRGPNRRRR
ncbi:MAG: DNA polymerase III subunit delta [Acidimicrobiia bacterium]